MIKIGSKDVGSLYNAVPVEIANAHKNSVQQTRKHALRMAHVYKPFKKPCLNHSARVSSSVVESAGLVGGKWITDRVLLEVINGSFDIVNQEASKVAANAMSHQNALHNKILSICGH